MAVQIPSCEETSKAVFARVSQAWTQTALQHFKNNHNVKFGIEGILLKCLTGTANQVDALPLGRTANLPLQ